MTKEQEDSIEILENTDISTIDLVENVDLYTYNIAIKNVLDMLKEKDKEIKQKDKIIELMAEELRERNYNFANKSIKDIKQYFERKLEYGR